MGSGDVYKRQAHLSNPRETLARLARMCTQRLAPALGSAHVPQLIDQLATDILQGAEELAKKTPPVANEANAKTVKSLASQKRRAFADMLKELRRLGLSPFVSAERLAQNHDAAAIHAVPPPALGAADAALGLDAVHQYHVALMAQLPRVRGAVAAPQGDVPVPDLQRALGEAESGASLALRLRARLTEQVRSGATLWRQAQRIACLARAGDLHLETEAGVAAAAARSEQLAGMASALEELASAVPPLVRASPLPSAAPWDEFATLAHRARRASGALAELVSALGETHLHLVSAAEQTLLERGGAELFAEAENVLGAALGAAPALEPYAAPTKAWVAAMRAAPAKAPAPAQPGDDAACEAASDELRSSLLVIAQTLQEVQPADAEQLADAALPAELARLEQAERLLKPHLVSARLESALGRPAAPAALQRTARELAPFLELYAQLLYTHVQALSFAYRSVARLTLVVCVILNNLATRGFCTPPEEQPEAGEDAEEGGEQLEGGTGLGEGQGAKDVSDTLKDDEQMEELQQDEEQGEQGEDTAKADKARETEDVEGEAQSADEQGAEDGQDGEEEQEQEMKDEIGDVDPLDPSAVDEKMWAGEDQAQGESEGADPQAAQDREQAGERRDEAPEGKDQPEGEAEPEPKPEPEPEPELEEMKEQEGMGRALDQEAKEEDKLELDEQEGQDDGQEDEKEELDEDKQEMDQAEGHGQPESKAEDGPQAEPEGEQPSGEEAMSLDGDAPEGGEEEGQVPEGEEDEEHEELMRDDQEGQDDGQDAEQTDQEVPGEGEADHEEPRPDEGGQDAQDTQAKEAGEQPKEQPGPAPRRRPAPQRERAPDTLHDTAEAPTEDAAGDDAGASGGQQDAAGAQGMPGADASEDAAQAPDTQADGEPRPGESTGAGQDAGAGSAPADAAADGAPPGEEEERPNPLRSLGDSLAQFRQDLDAIHEASEEAGDAGDAGAEEAGDVEHVAPDQDAEMQAVGAADEQQAAQMHQFARDETRPEPAPMDVGEDAAPEPPSLEEPPAGEREALPHAERAISGHDVRGEERVEAADGAPGEAHGAPDEERVSPVPDEERHAAEEHVAEELAAFRASDAELARAADLWRSYVALTNDLAFALCEQLRLILTPTLATRLSGDYRTGKRLNMRKIVPFIASDFAKDKIWLRRTKPSAREYQVLLSIDDSRSMAESRNMHLAYQTLALVAGALTRLEVGDIGICRFGQGVEMLHEFGQTAFSDAHGGQILSRLRFEQRSTNVPALLSQTLQILEEARQARSASAAELWQLQIVISDGVCQDHEQIRALLRRAVEERVMVVFVVVDAGAAGDEPQPGAPPRSSILTMNQVDYHTDAQGRLQLEMKRYIDTFPFEYYVIVRDVQALPAVLATTLRQWAERIREAA